LTASGFVVDEARNGEEALAVVRARPFDLVLLDINMAGAGGIDACRRIRNCMPQIGIVLATVRESEHDKVTALEAGADDYVTKPLRLTELVARIRAVLRRILHPHLARARQCRHKRQLTPHVSAYHIWDFYR
jgi:two-component system KDP operon response regulator KdpE